MHECVPWNRLRISSQQCAGLATIYFDQGGAAPFKQNQFGANLGGPVLKDRTSFFFAYDGQRRHRSNQTFATVPDPAQLTGNFSALKDAAGKPIIITDPFNKNGPFAGNVIPPGRISPLVLAYNKYIPAPNTNLPQGNFTGNPETLDDFDQYLIKVDHRFSNLAESLGLKNLSVASYDFSLPRFNITGFTQLGHSQQTFHQWTNAYILSDTLALVHGNHNMILGGDVRVYRSPQSTSNGSNGRITVSNIFTGYALSDYLLGAFQQATAFTSLLTGDYRNQQYALYFQDDYKILPRLTLNLGLRWEYSSPTHETNGSEGYFDQAAGVLRLAQSPSIYGINISSPSIVVGGVSPGVYQPDYKQFAPRIGLAYQLNQKTVIRSGYGIFYITNQGSHTIEISVNPGAAITVTSTNSKGQIPRLVDTLFDSVSQSAVQGGNSLQTISPERQPSYMQQWNLNIQRELPFNTILEVGYAGSNGIHLVGTTDINAARLNNPDENLSIAVRRPYPAFSFIQQYGSGEQSNYNALLVRAERRFSSGLSLLASYTFSKLIDDGSAGLNDAQVHQNSNNISADRSLSAFDVRNLFAFSGVWELPFGNKRRFLSGAAGLAGRLVNGWQVNTVVLFQDGSPFNPTEQGDIAQTGGQSVQRPNRIADGNLPVSERTPSRWFDMGAFVLANAGTLGNSGRNILFTNGTKNVDLSLFKNNYFGERNYNLQFRAEFFNLLNDTNFGVPAQAVNGPNFGVVTSTGPAREV